VTLTQACNSGSGPQKAGDNSQILVEKDPSQLAVKHASGFSIELTDTGYLLMLHDPWNSGQQFAEYKIVNEKNLVKAETGVIHSDPKRVVAFSTTHIGFMDALDVSTRLVACTTPDRLYHEALRSKYLDGELVGVGSDMEYNLESLIDQQPDVIIQTGFANQKAKDVRLHQAGFDVLYILEWMEKTPLGRAEWIKVFGLLFNRYAEAEQLFNEIEKEYLAMAARIQEVGTKPQVLVGNNFKGTWYIPGNSNYMARFLQDAGFDYEWSPDGVSASRPLSFETIALQYRNAPVWLNVSAYDLNSLARDNNRYRIFQAFKTGEVYSINRRTSINNGNDFWEGAVVKPHWVLADLIHIAHPTYLPEHDLIYYTKLK